MLILSAGLASYAAVAIHVREQRKVRDELLALGAQAYFDYEYARGGYTPENSFAPAAPAWVRYIWGDEAFEHIELVAFERPNEASDDNLQLLLKTPELEVLKLWGDGVSDRSMAMIGALRHLEELELCDTDVSDKGVAQLTGLQHLVYLSLRGTQITNASLPEVARIADLQSLDLSDTSIDDDNLDCLSQLTKLQSLSLGPHVAIAKAREVKVKLPNCTVCCIDEQGRSLSIELEQP